MKLALYFFLLFFGIMPAKAETDEELLEKLLWPAISNAPLSKRPAVGIALAGGGARAFTHTGVLQAMEYAAFPIDYIAGTSMGAVLGAFYAAGKPVSQLWELGGKLVKLGIKKDFYNIKLFSLLFSNKMMPAENIRYLISEIFGKMNIEDLQKPFACVAMDIRTGEKIVFRSGSVALATAASANFPGFFEPMAYNQRYLVDGGVVENIPVDAVRALGASWVIASVDNLASDALPEDALSVLMQVIDVRGRILAEAAVEKSDFVIDPPVGGISTTSFEKALMAAKLGLYQASKDMPHIKRGYMLEALPLMLKGAAK